LVSGVGDGGGLKLAEGARHLQGSASTMAGTAIAISLSQQRMQGIGWLKQDRRMAKSQPCGSTRQRELLCREPAHNTWVTASLVISQLTLQGGRLLVAVCACSSSHSSGTLGAHLLLECGTGRDKHCLQVAAGVLVSRKPRSKQPAGGDNQHRQTCVNYQRKVYACSKPAVGAATNCRHPPNHSWQD
jgi:hypothetical protein